MGGGDVVIRVRTPFGPARLVFNPLEVSELSVIDELLPGGMYLVRHAADMLVDCGSFRGISTIYLQDQVKAPQVLAYEPEPANFHILAHRLARHLPNAVYINAAVGSHSGQVGFEGCGVGGSISEKGAPVCMVCLREEKALRNCRSLLLKMDIEGAEMDVLPDLLHVLPQACTIFLETHCPQVAADKLLAPFREACFDVRKLRCREEPDAAATYIDWELARR